MRPLHSLVSIGHKKKRENKTHLILNKRDFPRASSSKSPSFTVSPDLALKVLVLEIASVWVRVNLC